MLGYEDISDVETMPEARLPAGNGLAGSGLAGVGLAGGEAGGKAGGKEEAKQEIHWDVAWQIFDEVNEAKDTERYIDLHCQDIEDALAICK